MKSSPLPPKYNSFRYIFLLILILDFNQRGTSQNLVPNPSFETTRDTISGFTSTYREFMKTTKNWISPNTATPDLITSDFYEKFITPPAARTGTNMAGIHCSENAFAHKHWSECIGVKLTESLNPQSTYHIEYYIRRANCSDPTLDTDEFLKANFGVLFTKNPVRVKSPDMLIGIPHLRGDTNLLITDTEWTRISGYFTPTEQYNYLYIGHFDNGNNLPQPYMRSYYVIDDVSVVTISDFEELDNSTSLPVGTKIPLKHINFISGTTKLDGAESKEVLNKLAKYLKDKPVRVRINGHTDSVGDEKSNKALSRNRAKAIANMLIRKGISKNRIEWRGFGEEKPIADNATKEGRAKNRRVEFEIID